MNCIAIWDQKCMYEGCSKSLWYEHEGVEIQGSFNVWEYYKSISEHLSRKKLSDLFAIQACAHLIFSFFLLDRCSHIGLLFSWIDLVYMIQSILPELLLAICLFTCHLFSWFDITFTFLFKFLGVCVYFHCFVLF